MDTHSTESIIPLNVDKVTNLNINAEIRELAKLINFVFPEMDQWSLVSLP